MRSAALVFAVLLLPAAAHAEDADPWLGKDKVLHIAAGATLGAGGYVAGTFAFESRGAALVTGAALASVVGIGKELVDLSGSGDPSWKDLTWDGIGALAGLALAWGNDLLGRGVDETRPLVLAPRVSPHAASLALQVAF